LGANKINKRVMKTAEEKLNFDLPEMPSLNIDAVISRFIQEQQKKEEEIFTTALRTMAEPPIKGEITKGKVRWRGIRIVQQNDGGFKYTKWLEQRGKQISPKIVFEGTIENGL
jgi:hypothetical protein